MSEQNDVEVETINPPVSQSTTSAQAQQIPPQPSRVKKTGILIVAVAVIIFVVVGLLYRFVYASPTRVWKKFASSTLQSVVVTQQSNVSYQDNENSTDTAGSLAFIAGFLSKAHLAVDANMYANSMDINNPESSGNFSVSFGSGSISYSSKLNVLLKDKNLYLDLGTNPFFAGLLATYEPGKKIDWVKFDLQAFQNDANKNTASSSAPAVNMQEQMAQFKSLFASYEGKILTSGTYIGKEKVQGVSTYHYSNTIDKNELKNFLNDVSSKFLTQTSGNSSENPTALASAQADAHRIIDVWVNNLHIKMFETWIGVSDARLYKISYASNAPSLASLVGQEEKYQQEAYNATTTPSSEDTFNNIVNNTKFDADFSFQTILSDYGKTKPVSVPTNSLDLMKLKESQEASTTNNQIIDDSFLEMQ